jgi:hypothetical protein
MSLWLALVLIWFAAVVGFIWGARLSDSKWAAYHEDYVARERRAQMTVDAIDLLDQMQ